MQTFTKKKRDTVCPWFPFYTSQMPVKETEFRIFCFPYAGGSAQIFYPWREILPKGIEVCPVQMPGRGRRLDEAPYEKISSLIEVLSDAVRPYLNVPFAFFGHSMGALICFELTRQLRRLDYPTPVHLFVSGYKAPHLPSSSSAKHGLPPQEFISELRRLNGTPPEILESRELMDLLLPALHADFEVCETYQYKAEDPLDCPIAAFGGLGDPETKQYEIEAWAQETSKAFSVHMFPGDHFFLNSQQPALLNLIARKLLQS